MNFVRIYYFNQKLQRLLLFPFFAGGKLGAFLFAYMHIHATVVGMNDIEDCKDVCNIFST